MWSNERFSIMRNTMVSIWSRAETALMDLLLPRLAPGVELHHLLGVLDLRLLEVGHELDREEHLPHAGAVDEVHGEAPAVEVPDDLELPLDRGDGVVVDAAVAGDQVFQSRLDPPA